MSEFIICFIKYFAIFTCILYAYIKLLCIKLEVKDLFDIPIFMVLSAVLYFVTVYVKILVPIGLLIFGIVFLYLRFKNSFYETAKVGTIAVGISIVLMLPSFIIGFFIASALYPIEDEAVRMIIQSLIVAIIQIVFAFLLFKIKRLRSGVDPKGEKATFEILLFFSVGCVFALMIVYTKNATQSLYETVLLVLTLFGLLLILWWLRHITYTLQEREKRKKSNYLKKR